MHSPLFVVLNVEFYWLIGDFESSEIDETNYSGLYDDWSPWIYPLFILLEKVSFAANSFDMVKLGGKDCGKAYSPSWL